MFNWIITGPSCGDQKQYGGFPSAEHLYWGYLRCHGLLNNSPTSQFHPPLLTKQNTLWPNWPPWPTWPPDLFLNNFWPTWPTFHQLDQLFTTFHQLFTNLTNFSPTFHQLFTKFSPTWPTFEQLDQLDLTANNQLQSRANWIGSALAISTQTKHIAWITTTGDYEPNNCHQSSKWGCQKMWCPFFRLKKPFWTQKRTPHFETYRYTYLVEYHWRLDSANKTTNCEGDWIESMQLWRCQQKCII